MAYIETVPEREATGETAEIYAADRERMGYLPNYTQIFSERPAVYRGWQALNGAVKETMDLCRYELTTLAAARRLRSEYCSLAHGAVLRERFFDPEALATVASDAVRPGSTVPISQPWISPRRSPPTRTPSRPLTSSGCEDSASPTTRFTDSVALLGPLPFYPA